MTEITLKIIAMDADGQALGEGKRSRRVRVPFAVPGEEVRVRLLDETDRTAQGELIDIIKPSDERATPRCPHFGVCGGCTYQHMTYAAQLRAKQAIVADQFKRLGKLPQARIRPIWANPKPYDSQTDFIFLATDQGLLGLWSPWQERVIPIETCHLVHPRLRELLEDDIDFDLPTLRRLMLRIGSDDELMMALEVDAVEPPSLHTDFPISATIILPTGVTANLIGDNTVTKSVLGRDFRVSAGCYFHPDLNGAAQLAQTVLEFAALSGQETVIEAYSGVGMLTAFLAEHADRVICIEANEDAVNDAAINLYETENVSIYNDWIEDVLPTLRDEKATVMVLDPSADGVSAEILRTVIDLAPRRLIYSSSVSEHAARDARALTRAGYRLSAAQPIDMQPQTPHIHVVALWRRG
jgi:23S rRNA (uracil1939-C5)-methyltransferase